MTEQREAFRELVEAMAAPGHPDRLGIILSGSVAGFLGALNLPNHCHSWR